MVGKSGMYIGRHILSMGVPDNSTCGLCINNFENQVWGEGFDVIQSEFNLCSDPTKTWHFLR